MLWLEKIPFSVKIVIILVFIVSNIIYFVKYFNTPKDSQGRRLEEKDIPLSFKIFIILLWMFVGIMMYDYIKKLLSPIPGRRPLSQGESLDRAIAAQERVHGVWRGGAPHPIPQREIQPLLPVEQAQQERYGSVRRRIDFEN